MLYQSKMLDDVSVGFPPLISKFTLSKCTLNRGRVTERCWIFFFFFFVVCFWVFFFEASFLFPFYTSLKRSLEKSFFTLLLAILHKPRFSSSYWQLYLSKCTLKWRKYIETVLNLSINKSNNTGFLLRPVPGDLLFFFFFLCWFFFRSFAAILTLCQTKK